ncbi:MAG TPA: VTC domain-containing protein [Bacteroidia bacterium]|jgi:hypothetical protein
MIPGSSPQEELRHERKFLITAYSVREVEQIIKLHPACFTEVYSQREINNIYFDSFGYDSYYDNVEGEKFRSKARIRWYGELFGTIRLPVLEYKIKEGLLGKKNSYSLSSFVLDKTFSKEQIINAFKTKSIPDHIRKDILTLRPALLNSYSRRYFLSADGLFRMTIDWGLTYYRINYSGNTFLNRSKDHNTTVVELKYSSALENKAKEIGSSFPFVLTKSSKYLQGIERVLF